MTFPAKVVEQLHDGAYGPWDCWIASARGLCAFASDGKVRLDWQTARERSGKYVEHPSAADLQRLGGGELADIKRVLAHPDTVAAFEKAGLRPPKVRILGITKANTVLTYLTLGYQAAVAINYGTLRELRPRNAGSSTFSGGHSVRWYGAFDANGRPKTDLAAPFYSDQLDPLCDGRRAGIAKGPQRLNQKTLLQEAADTKLHDGAGNVIGRVGKGNVMALVVKPAKKLPANPDPAPADPCADAVAEASSERDAALAEVDRLQGLIRTIAATVTDAQAPLNAIAALVGDPANAGEVEP